MQYANLTRLRVLVYTGRNDLTVTDSSGALASPTEMPDVPTGSIETRCKRDVSLSHIRLRSIYALS